MKAADKKKIAPEAATSETKSKNIDTNHIVPENEGKIKCVLQHPGEISETIELENDYMSIKELLGGKFHHTEISENGLNLIYPATIYTNGKRKNLKPNVLLYDSVPISGTVIITNFDECGDMVSLTKAQIQSARDWLRKHTYEEEAQK